ncbi:MAG: hypothetical protein HY770_08285, partial [Chitinivibrionia bacterium]|nr:hypothetical protein [Chitinivibrionia bacterium]
MSFASRISLKPLMLIRRSARGIRIAMLSCFVLIHRIAGCGKRGKPAEQPLTQDEHYLVDTYVNVIRAKDLHGRNPSIADSLFSAIDSTTDTL